jgi:hypothetical protein
LKVDSECAASDLRNLMKDHPDLPRLTAALWGGVPEDAMNFTFTGINKPANPKPPTV